MCHCLLQDQAVTDIPPIMDALFECTLEMLNKDMEEFPEHRLHFFSMLQSFTQHCFPGMLKAHYVTHICTVFIEYSFVSLGHILHLKCPHVYTCNLCTK